MKSIASALAAAQINMGKALKQSSNPHLKSKYADLGSVMDACLPALNESGIAVIQPAGEDETGRYVETVFIHGESGERLSCRVPLIVGKNDMQGYGSAVTYARRYGLMAMAGIAPEDDDGHAASQSAPRQQQQQRQAAPAQEAIDKACTHIREATDMDELKSRWGKLPKIMKAVPAVIVMKNAAKERLSAPQPDLEAIDNACAHILEATDMDHLQRRWGGVPKKLQENPAVIAMKNAIHERLLAPQPDLDDEIPY